MTEVFPVWLLPSKTPQIWNLTAKLHYSPQVVALASMRVSAEGKDKAEQGKFSIQAIITGC